MRVIVLIILLLMITTVSAFGLERTELPEEGQRLFKVGYNRHYWFSCSSFSMGPVLNCSKTYWAYSGGYMNDWNVNATIGDVVAYNIPKKWRAEYYEKHNVKIKYFIHRIVGKNESCWVLKGDANEYPDPVCVTDDMIRYVILWEEPETWRLTPEDPGDK